MAKSSRTVFDRIGKDVPREPLKIHTLCLSILGGIIYLTVWLILTVGWLFPLGAFVTGVFLGAMKITFRNVLLVLSATLGYWLIVALWQTIQPWGYSSQIAWLVVPILLSGCGLTLFVRFRAASQPTVT